MFLLLPTQVDDNRPTGRIPWANTLLVIVNVLLFPWSLSMMVGPGTGLMSVMTYAFAHDGWTHLIVNMWVLLIFGSPVNRRLGNGLYLLAYLGAAVAVGMLAKIFWDGYLLGASGAIFAVIAMCLLLMPSALVRCFYIVIFPLSILIGLISKPKEAVYWFIRWDNFAIRAYWCLLFVPLLEIFGLMWCWNYTNLAHLLGLFCGVVAVLALPASVSMRRRVRYGA